MTKQLKSYYINHDKCGDKRKRLGVTIFPSYTLHHCFKCGESWKTYNNYKQKLTVHKSVSIDREGEPRQVKIPRDVEYNLELFPAKERAWLMKYGITADDCRRYSICYGKLKVGADYQGRIILPVMDGDGLAFYTARSLTEQPKYMTYRNRPAVFVTGKGDHLVIVEDIISAIKVEKVGGVKVCALCGSGSNFPPAILEGVAKVTLFLDNDNAKVKKSMRDMRKRLDNLGYSVVVVRQDKDPKDFTVQQLKEIIC